MPISYVFHIKMLILLKFPHVEHVPNANGENRALCCYALSRPWIRHGAQRLRDPWIWQKFRNTFALPRISFCIYGARVMKKVTGFISISWRIPLQLVYILCVFQVTDLCSVFVLSFQERLH